LYTLLLHTDFYDKINISREQRVQQQAEEQDEQYHLTQDAKRADHQDQDQ
jgi:hypothetical protein